jgi:hypothetical protein
MLGAYARAPVTKKPLKSDTSTSGTRNRLRRPTSRICDTAAVRFGRNALDAVVCQWKLPVPRAAAWFINAPEIRGEESLARNVSVSIIFNRAGRISDSKFVSIGSKP